MTRAEAPGDRNRICLLFVGSTTAESYVAELAAHGFQVVTKSDAQSLNGELVRSDLLVLDATKMGIESVREIRRRSDKPIFVLSSCPNLAECVQALESGADEYESMSSNMLEIAARIRAVVRRSRGDFQRRVEQMEVGDIVMQFQTRLVLQNGRPVTLTSVEFDLLKLLLSSSGSVVSRKDISEKLFGGRFSPRSRSIDVHISRLRRKLGNQIGQIERIRTIRGQGYFYCANTSDAQTFATIGRNAVPDATIR